MRGNESEKFIIIKIINENNFNGFYVKNLVQNKLIAIFFCLHPQSSSSSSMKMCGGNESMT